MTARRRPLRVAAARPLVAVALALSMPVAMLAAGCAGADPATPAATGGDAREPATVVVSAASSLAAALGAIVDDFTAANPGVDVVLTTDGSSTLATQILDGAPVDVFAAADDRAMARVGDAGLLDGPPTVVATNRLAIVTRPGNPDGVTGIGDLAGLGVVALCAPEVPCGRYAARMLDDAGVTLDEASVTRGRSAAGTVAAVADGDADAAIVYATDAIAAGDAVAVVALPASPVVTYPMAVVANAGSSDAARAAARALVDWVAGDAGQAVLARFGFGPP